jgi:hypothetical protein
MGAFPAKVVTARGLTILCYPGYSIQTRSNAKDGAINMVRITANNSTKENEGREESAEDESRKDAQKGKESFRFREINVNKRTIMVRTPASLVPTVLPSGEIAIYPKSLKPIRVEGECVITENEVGK